MTDGPTSAFGLPASELIDLFQTGEFMVEGRMPHSSNITLLVTISDAEPGAGPNAEARSHRAIYKPGQGERPLGDFPPGLYRREAAMYRLAAALDLSVIPPTTLAEGPFGEGSVQAFVDADFEEHYFTLLETDRGTDDLQKLCALDIIANNTDRKSGHCLLGSDDRVYGIDHGLSFHAQFKLRTVLWDYVGEPLPADLAEAMAKFVDDGPPTDLVCLLDRFEVDAMMQRTQALLTAGVFPEDDTGGRRWPWPLV